MEREIHYECNTCEQFYRNKDIYGCIKGNIYPSENDSPVCIDCECYIRKGEL